MATKESAKKKYVNSVTSDTAIDKMTRKLGSYLGIDVDDIKKSAPVKQWKGFTEKADDYFDKLYENMKAAYGG